MLRPSSLSFPPPTNARQIAALKARTPKAMKPAWTKHHSFESEEADLILRSSDGDEFRVFRRILIEASDVFRNMFSMPQPNDTPPHPDIPVIDLSERAVTLNDFLLCLYPLPNPKFETIEELQVMFEVARKYAATAAADILRARLGSQEMLTKTLPLRVYALACKEGLEEEKKIASAACLDIDIDRAALWMEAIWPDELRDWSSLDLVRLYRLRDTRFELASELVRGLVGRGMCPAGNCRHDFSTDYFPDFQEAALTELRKCPTSKVIFTHAFVTSCLSKQAATCFSCAKEYMTTSAPILANLRRRIDTLPDTI